MSLTAGRGPFSTDPAGRFDAPVPRPVLFWDPVPQRIRALLGSETVLDSDRAALLHETGSLPVYYVPRDDVRSDLLEPSGRVEDTERKGRQAFWHVRLGERVVPDAVWAHPDPPETAAFLAGHVALVWSSFDEWFVEDEQAFGHPRDPYARIDVYRTSRRVRVSIDGMELADSRRTKALYESNLPTRWYFPPEDVRADLLVPSPTRSRCAYKGSASYWHVRVGDRLVEDVVWSYPAPQHDAEPVRDRFCFFNERVELELDGVIVERPTTQYSRD
jgi:uncharacterized protein (DUF427 family)